MQYGAKSIFSLILRIVWDETATPIGARGVNEITRSRANAEPGEGDTAGRTLLSPAPADCHGHEAEGAAVGLASTLFGCYIVDCRLELVQLEAAVQ